MVDYGFNPLKLPHMSFHKLPDFDVWPVKEMLMQKLPKIYFANLSKAKKDLRVKD